MPQDLFAGEVMSETCYRVNAPGVIYEQFEDELVAIHLDTGAYHSLVGAAADAFLLLNEEATLSELADALSVKYAASSEQIAGALGGFLQQLEKEQLIATVDVRKQRPPLRLDTNQSGVPFVPPNVAAYHDLESLFLLDPIHEVGDMGWPQNRPENG